MRTCLCVLENHEGQDVAELGEQSAHFSVGEIDAEVGLQTLRLVRKGGDHLITTDARIMWMGRGEKKRNRLGQNM